MTRLLLIRHGQTPGNVAGQLDTEVPGPPLTELGVEQAEAVAEVLGRELITSLHASSQLRAQQTAAPLARVHGLPVLVDDDLREVSAGDWVMRSDDEAVQGYLDVLHTWMTGDHERRMPGGPSGTEFLARYDAAVRRVTAGTAPGDTVAVVSHGAAIRVWATVRGLNVDADFGIRNRLPNTGVVALEADPAGGWMIDTWLGQPLGGPAVDDPDGEGPAGEPSTDPF
ncbi:histidine phosphatase family protein [Nakamurella flavida]|uniref:Histidine phosphatase family protein n=1 Tax=Nakamurella flavida TaxID=363630 RepID=A0A938YQY0_9ACTN|nr:histidine phosphatase family protein [Nakamurella flavida]MBM9477799.1 histidine phosphatase family protein [Nakamurella flavida]MDP9779352.1 putative phosphoglycerate mutase [Nakamurella flavida]